MTSDRVKQRILENAEEIKRLRARIAETMRHRSAGPEKRREWQSACAEFHNRYNALAFPGGYDVPVVRSKEVL